MFINNVHINITKYLESDIPMNVQQRDKILKLLREKKVITSSELAKFLGISWNTAQSYLMELALEEEIIRIKKEGVNLWILK
jgi:DeoR/GlpR family transcriptional regulator of sugar metabolism